MNISIETISCSLSNTMYISSSEVRKPYFHELRSNEWKYGVSDFTRWNIHRIRQRAWYSLFIIYTPCPFHNNFNEFVENYLTTEKQKNYTDAYYSQSWCKSDIVRMHAVISYRIGRCTGNHWFATSDSPKIYNFTLHNIITIRWHDAAVKTHRLTKGANSLPTLSKGAYSLSTRHSANR